jgi:hypothetical protein
LKRALRWSPAKAKRSVDIQWLLKAKAAAR